MRVCLMDFIVFPCACSRWYRPLPTQGHPRHGQEQAEEALEGEAIREVRQLQPHHANPLRRRHRLEEGVGR